MKKQLYWIIPLSSIFLFFVVYAVYTLNDNNPSDFERVITKNQELTFSSLEGENVAIESIVRSSDFTLVYTWASWCPFCAEDLVYLDEIAATNTNLQILALNRKESTHQANRFLSTIGPLDNITILIDSNDNYYKEIDGFSMPEGVLYNSEGSVVSHIRGSIRNVDILDFIK